MKMVKQEPHPKQINTESANSCMCYSGFVYKECCEPYHQGTRPPNALCLMRSRYCAYALGLSKYIMDTTHPENIQYMDNREKWEKQILDFSKKMSFNGLKILDFEDLEPISTVTFTALLSTSDQDHTFTEKSKFQKYKDRWCYLSGEFLVI